MDVIYHFYCILLAYIPYWWPISPISPMQCFYRPASPWLAEQLRNNGRNRRPIPGQTQRNQDGWHPLSNL